MCDRLISLIDRVDAEVSGLVYAWTSVQEGGKSLQDASQKLLDERVSSDMLGGLHERWMVFFLPSRTGWWICKEPLGQPWNISSSSSTRDVYSTTPVTTHLSSKSTFSIWSSEWTSALSSSNPTYDCLSAFASSRSYSHTCYSAIAEKRQSTSCVSSNA